MDTNNAETDTKGTNDSGNNVHGLPDDTVRTNDDSLPSNKGPSTDTNIAETEGGDNYGSKASSPAFDPVGTGDDDDNLSMTGDPDDMDSNGGRKFNLLAKAMMKMQEKVTAMESRFGAAGGLGSTQHIKAEHIKMEPIRVKSEHAQNDTIDLVSSSNDSDSDDFAEANAGTMSVPEPSVTVKRSKMKREMSASETKETSAPPARQRTNTKGTAIKTPSYTQSQQRRDISLRNWSDGMKRQATKERIYNEISESTADNLPQILANMRVTGFGVVKNYKKLKISSTFGMDDSSSDERESSSEPKHKCVFAVENMPDAAQAYYHETAGWNTSGTAKTPKHDILFEGVTINSRDYEFKTRMSKLESTDKSGRVPRHAMAAKSKALAAYNEKYAGQMEDIVRGMFANERMSNGCDPADPSNWHMAQNIVWGGTGHQHPHCDQGKAGCFNTDQIFPFVCIHGFGLHQFAMWLLPAKRKREYGFPFRFPKYAMLFLRGDCIHAGAYSQLSRAHLEFWPRAMAGWTRTRHPYWATPESMASWQSKKVVFLIPDLRTYPFGYPDISEEDENGNQSVTYPVKHTEELFPHLDDTYMAKKDKGDAVLPVKNADAVKRPLPASVPQRPKSVRRKM
jgi:hypothetical protein